MDMKQRFNLIFMKQYGLFSFVEHQIQWALVILSTWSISSKRNDFLDKYIIFFV